MDRSLQLSCPTCQQLINPADVNIGSDMAKCTSCNSIFRASELINIADEQTLMSPPVPTEIQLYRRSDDAIEVVLGKRRLRALDLPLLGFAIFWLSFVAFWTFGAAQASIFFALFSIPFWFVGFGMLFGLLNSLVGSQKISIERDRIIIDKKHLVGNKRYAISYQNIVIIQLLPYKGNPFALLGQVRSASSPSNKKQVINIPALVLTDKAVYFFENASAEEQKWITSLLSTVLKKRKS